MSENKGKRGERKVRRYTSRSELFSISETELIGGKVMLLACAKVCHREGNKLFSLPTGAGQQNCNELVVDSGDQIS